MIKEKSTAVAAIERLFFFSCFCFCVRISHPLICEQDRERRRNREIKQRERGEFFLVEAAYERQTFFSPGGAGNLFFSFFSPAFSFRFPLLFFFLRHPSSAWVRHASYKRRRGRKRKKKGSKRKDRKSSPFFSLFVYLLSLSHPALVRITHPTGRGEGRAPQKKAFFITR